MKERWRAELAAMLGDPKTPTSSEAQAQAVCMAHPDFQEAYNASVEKRPPRFK